MEKRTTVLAAPMTLFESIVQLDRPRPPPAGIPLIAEAPEVYDQPTIFGDTFRRHVNATRQLPPGHGGALVVLHVSQTLPTSSEPAAEAKRDRKRVARLAAKEER